MKKKPLPYNKRKDKNEENSNDEQKPKRIIKLKKTPIKLKQRMATPPKMKYNPTLKSLKDEGMRLNKYIAHTGLCSRRKADEHIKKGLVTVNGAVVVEMGHKIFRGDVVKFEGKVMTPEQKVYVLLNKPKDMITTLKDEKGRKTVMDIISNASTERLYPVGRLDRQTTGLLLFTNDGELAQRLMHPSFLVRKLYHVTLDKPLTKHHLEKIVAGITLEDGKIPVDGIEYVSGSGKCEVGIQIHIGRNRIVRRLFEHLGYTVKKLDRVLYGGLTKKDLPRGKWRYLNPKELIMLKHFKG